MTGFGAGTRPAEEKLHIRALGSDLKDDTEFAAAGDGALHTAAGFRMGVCDMPLVCGCLCFASGLYVGRGTFAPATFRSLAGVVHVECVTQWVVEGSKARGITALALQLLSADEPRTHRRGEELNDT